MLKKLSRTLLTAGAAGVTLAATLIGSTLPAEAASGGGCNGWAVRACVSVRNGDVIADGYLNSVPSGCYRVSVALIDGGYNTITSSGTGCYSGWLGNAPSVVYPGHGTYYGRVRVWDRNNNIIAEQVSPAQY